jgi:hypothetical protein
MAVATIKPLARANPFSIRIASSSLGISDLAPVDCRSSCHPALRRINRQTAAKGRFRLNESLAVRG